MKRIAKLPKPPTTQAAPDKDEVPLPGFIAIGDQYYDVGDDAEVDPKDVIAEGDDRYRNLPDNDRNKILEALINEPDPESKEPGGKKPKRIKMNQIKDGDEVLEQDIIPHHFFGESPAQPDPTVPENTLPP